MNKTIKRIFSVVLTMCLLLSVIPAIASAEDTPTTQTYVFKKANGTTNLSGSFKSNITTKLSSSTAVNWYTLASAMTTTSGQYSGGQLSISNKYSGNWLAMMITVSADGLYDLTSQMKTRETDFTNTHVMILDPNKTMSDGKTYKEYILSKNESRDSGNTFFKDLQKEIYGVADQSLILSGNMQDTYAYFGSANLKKGEYILLLSPRHASSSSNHYCQIVNFKLTPSTEAGASFISQVSAACYSGGNVVTDQVKPIYQLGTDLNAPSANLLLCAQKLELNGHTLTVNTVSKPCDPKAGVISGISDKTGGDAKVVTSGSAPLLPSGQQQILINTGVNTYSAFSCNLISGETFTGLDFMSDPSNIGFAFQIDMPDAAKALIAQGGTDFAVRLECHVGLEEVNVVFASEYLMQWANGEGDTFYVEFADPDSLLAKYGVISCTPKIVCFANAFTGTTMMEKGTKQDWDDDGVLKILSISNSYGHDTVEYVYQIAKNMGVQNVQVAYLYRSGCSLSEHLSYLQNGGVGYTYYYTDANGAWQSRSSTARDAIVDQSWDYIAFQQNSGGSDEADTYAVLNDVLDIVETIRPKARYIWNMTWAYQSSYSTMYPLIVSAVESQIVTNDRIEAIMPVGTAIQNARTSYLNEIDGKIVRDTNSHLSEGFGRYTAGLTFYCKLMNVDPRNVTWKPSSVTDAEAAIARECAYNAIATPFAVTNSTYTTAP